MTPEELERIRVRVERGEVLSATELSQLEAAAGGGAGPTLKLALAHAWVNAEQHRRAIPLLEGLARDFPRDVQTHLGLARAYFAADRFAEAERAAQKALEVNPGDMEAEKSLAIIALRRGEFRRARQLAQGVIDRDPFDTEARMLRDELDAVDPPAPPTDVVLKPQFVERLERALQQEGRKFAVRGDELLLEAGRDVARVDLASLYRSFLTEKVQDDAAIARIGQELMRGKLDAFTAEDLRRILPVLRETAFAARIPGAATAPVGEGLSLFFVVEDPDLVRYVPLAALQREAVSLDELRGRAFARLEQRSVDPLFVEVVGGVVQQRAGPTRLQAVATGDGSDAARLLVPGQRARLGPLPKLVWLGSRDLVLLAAADDERARRDLEDLPANRDAIEGLFLLGEDGALRRQR